jgi:hypothetical protein
MGAGLGKAKVDQTPGLAKVVASVVLRVVIAVGIYPTIAFGER